MKTREDLESGEDSPYERLKSLLLAGKRWPVTEAVLNNQGKRKGLTDSGKGRREKSINSTGKRNTGL